MEVLRLMNVDMWRRLRVAEGQSAVQTRRREQMNCIRIGRMMERLMGLQLARLHIQALQRGTASVNKVACIHHKRLTAVKTACPSFFYY